MLSKRKIKCVIFDFDGVIVDSYNFHVSKIKEIYGIEIIHEEYKNMHNGNFFASNEESELKKVDWFNYKEKIKEDQAKLKINDKVKDILKLLSQNHMLYIVTSGSEVNIKMTLENNSIKKYFKNVYGPETEKSKEKKLKKILEERNLTSEETVFITDTLGDILEANSLNIPSIGVTWGFHEEERLLRGNPLHIAHSIVEVKDFIKSYEEKSAIKIRYKNLKGEESIRNILPLKIEFTSNEFHKEEQWILNALDLGKKEKRTFPIKNIKEFL